jgi:hypothetical protein
VLYAVRDWCGCGISDEDPREIVEVEKIVDSVGRVREVVEVRMVISILQPAIEMDGKHCAVEMIGSIV